MSIVQTSYWWRPCLFLSLKKIYNSGCMRFLPISEQAMQCISYSSVLKTQLEMFSKKRKRKRKTPGLGAFLKFLLFCFRKWDPANKNYRKHFSVSISSQWVPRPIFFESVYPYFQQKGCLREEFLNKFFLLVNISFKLNRKIVFA